MANPIPIKTERQAIVYKEGTESSTFDTEPTTSRFSTRLADIRRWSFQKEATPPYYDALLASGFTESVENIH